ncbi:hypothetical protein STTU_p0089 (plasmid) [Streptomyces sp. Tu6071]|nr:hypothetical protein STTU_p0089 [Streptomyces sp. Tu6071]
MRIKRPAEVVPYQHFQRLPLKLFFIETLNFFFPGKRKGL